MTDFCSVADCPDYPTAGSRFCERHYEQLYKARKARANAPAPAPPRGPALSLNPPTSPTPPRANGGAPTMRSVLADVPATNARGMVNPRNPGSVVAGLEEEAAPTTTGLHLLTPGQVAGLRIVRVNVGSTVTGYQRELRTQHARTIARRMLEGHPFPPILYALDEAGGDAGEIVDGQHRAAGAIISRMPVWAVAFYASDEERSQLFASQRAAVTIDPATLILAGSRPWHDYARAMLTSDDNPWRMLVTKAAGRDTIGMPTAYALANQYAVRNLGTHTPTDETFEERWSPERADELAALLSVLPSKRTTPSAWSIRVLRCLKNLALLIGEIDEERWALRIARFDYPFAATFPQTSEILEALIDTWNLGLPAAHHIHSNRGAA